MQFDRPSPSETWRWVALSAIALGVFVVLIVLVVPPLLLSPPSLGEPYDPFLLNQASTTLEPGKDHLVETQDGRVAVFIPKGAHTGSGQFMVRVREPQLVPARLEGNYQRQLAVDLMFFSGEGSPLQGEQLPEAVLLCFRLSHEQRAVHQSSPWLFAVQRFAEETAPPSWQDIAQAPGWEPGHLCGLVEHLSLFALAQHFDVLDPSASGKELATPEITVFPLRPYAVPTPE